MNNELDNFSTKEYDEDHTSSRSVDDEFSDVCVLSKNNNDNMDGDFPNIFSKLETALKSIEHEFDLPSLRPTDINPTCQVMCKDVSVSLSCCSHLLNLNIPCSHTPDLPSVNNVVIDTTDSNNDKVNEQLRLYGEFETRHQKANFVSSPSENRSDRCQFQSSLELNPLQGLRSFNMCDLLVPSHCSIGNSPKIILEEPCLKNTHETVRRVLRKERQKRLQQHHVAKQLLYGYPLKDLGDRRLRKFKTAGFSLFPNLLNGVNENKGGVDRDDFILSRNAFDWYDDVNGRRDCRRR